MQLPGYTLLEMVVESPLYQHEGTKAGRQAPHPFWVFCLMCCCLMAHLARPHRVDHQSSAFPRGLCVAPADMSTAFGVKSLRIFHHSISDLTSLALKEPNPQQHSLKYHYYHRSRLC